MLKSLKIRNFRSLENFEVSKLGRVNLIVGKNNSGKSSVLEALRIYAGNAQIGLLEEIAAGHDEKFRLHESDRYENDVPLPFEDLFTGRKYPDEEEQGIEIGEINSKETLKIEHSFYIEWRESIPDGNNDEPSLKIFRKRISKADLATQNNLENAMHALFTRKADRVAMIRLDSSSPRFKTTIDTSGITACSYIPTQFISVDELANEWDKIALTESQDVVKEALKIISPDFQDITFVRQDEQRYARKAFERTAKVKLVNHSYPVPLNSLGDGMLRVLQLVLKVFSAKGGILLVDEFENGLHYSVQEKVWTLIFELSHRLNIQIFATTHSWDCIESFAKVAHNHKHLDIAGVLFRVGRSALRSEQGRVIATVFDDDQLFNITQADVEVR